METQITQMQIVEDTLIQLERNGGYTWHNQGDCRLLVDIIQHKPRGLFERLLDWILLR